MSDYEAAVYKDDTDELALAIKTLVEEKTAHVTDDRIRRAMVAAATITAMQLLDGASIERDEAIRPDGFADTVDRCVKDCRERWRSR